ncbi:MAG: ImmA/IrrE family metallo-endopeptidase [Planctomycetaceae bacterium]|nr:ImmA/IrrE family metallo-endopeptidase [Planctomycetaceae bacterium]
MAKSAPSNAIPKMLEWARKTAHLSASDVELAEGLEAGTVGRWENGAESPTIAVLRKIAKRYKRPLMVFYLEEPPVGFTVVRDFRLLPASADREFSPALHSSIRFAQERQRWASQYLQDESADQFSLPAEITDKSSPIATGRELRKALNVTLNELAECTDERGCYNLWRSSCENVGIFVFQSSGVEVSEMRGFALYDKYAPTVVVNSRDSYNGRIFTLIHEVAHILLGQTGVSGAGPAFLKPRPSQKVERFCNQVAAETLVPLIDFKRNVPKHWNDKVIQALSRRYRVSPHVVVVRLLDAGLADQDYVRRKLRMLSKQKPKKTQSGGPLPHVRAMSRTGKLFSRMAVSAYRSGEIHGGELTNLLNLGMKHLPTVEGVLFPNRKQQVTST